MSLINLPPEKFEQVYEWKTDVLISTNGNEQRIAIRQAPRQTFKIAFLADSDEEIQYWRYELFTKLDNDWSLPIWAEAVSTTSESASGASTIDADFTLMDDNLGLTTFIIMSPNRLTAELVSFSSRTSTELTITGTLDNTYPTNSWLVPVELCITQNNSGYQAASVNVAQLSLSFQQTQSRVIEGKGSAALTMYKSIPVLDRRMEAGSDSFDEKLTRLDYGHKTELLSGQTYAGIISSREYSSVGDDDRQWWKLFLTTIRGQLKSFYSSTYRPDMTAVTSVQTPGTTTIDVLDDSTVAGGWENSAAHQELAIETLDGDTQFVTMTDAVDNLDGTHEITISPALTNTVDGSTILNMSFLELCRLASDSVSIDHQQGRRSVKLPTRTIQA